MQWFLHRHIIIPAQIRQPCSVQHKIIPNINTRQRTHPFTVPIRKQLAIARTVHHPLRLLYKIRKKYSLHDIRHIVADPFRPPISRLHRIANTPIIVQVHIIPRPLRTTINRNHTVYHTRHTLSVHDEIAVPIYPFVSANIVHTPIR